MQKLSEENIMARDAKRDLEAELQESLSQIKAGKISRITIPVKEGKYIESDVARIRIQLGRNFSIHCYAPSSSDHLSPPLQLFPGHWLFFFASGPDSLLLYCIGYRIMTIPDPPLPPAP